MSYNGYKNYPTWSLKLWIDNDEGLYELYYKELRYLDAHNLAERIKDDVEIRKVELKATGYIADILAWALEHIDYLTIAEYIVEAREE